MRMQETKHDQVIKYHNIFAAGKGIIARGIIRKAKNGG